MKKIAILTFMTIIAIIIFLSCKKEKSCEGCVNGNKPPIAIAGPTRLSLYQPTVVYLMDLHPVTMMGE